MASLRVPNAGTFSVQGHTGKDFWSTTAIDRERDLLCEDPMIYRQFCNAVLGTGYPPDAISSVHFRIQSQETVNRDYGGRRHEAISMLLILWKSD